MAPAATAHQSGEMRPKSTLHSYQNTAGLLALALAVARAASGASSDEHRIANIFKPVTTPGTEISNIATLALAVTGVIFVIVAALITFTLVRFRRRGAADDLQEPPQVYGSTQIEAAWTVLPILIVFVLTMVTARVVASVQDAKPPANALRATVIGHQWWWEIRYPELGIVTANELNVPEAGADHQPTFLKLQSVDVIHSFWIPQLGGKMDVIPNRNNELWMDPKETGVFLGACAEYCGTQHANMLIRVVVRPQDEFQKWASDEKRPAMSDASVAAQRRVFESLSCVNCHAVKGTPAEGTFGPDLTHLMSRATLASGMIPNTRENLRAWIKDPQEIKPGCFMPNMQLTDPQIDAVVAYLATLK
jgi:cytochrome c oxidase subunit II